MKIYSKVILYKNVVLSEFLHSKTYAYAIILCMNDRIGTHNVFVYAMRERNKFYFTSIQIRHAPAKG